MTAQPATPGSDSVHAQIAEVLRDWNALPPLACLPLAQREAVADVLVPLVDRLRAEAKAEALEEAAAWFQMLPDERMARRVVARFLRDDADQHRDRAAAYRTNPSSEETHCGC